MHLFSYRLASWSAVCDTGPRLSTTSEAFDRLLCRVTDNGISVLADTLQSEQSGRDVPTTLAQDGSGMGADLNVSILQGCHQSGDGFRTDSAQGDRTDAACRGAGFAQQLDQRSSGACSLAPDFSQGKGCPAPDHEIPVSQGFKEGGNCRPSRWSQFPQGHRSSAADQFIAIAQTGHQSGNRVPGGRSDFAQSGQDDPPNLDVLFSKCFHQGRDSPLGLVAHQTEHHGRLRTLHRIGIAQGLQPVSQV